MLHELRVRHARPAVRLHDFRLRCSLRQRLADLCPCLQAVGCRLHSAVRFPNGLKRRQWRGRLGTGAGSGGSGVVQRVACGAAGGHLVAGAALRQVLIPAQPA